MRRRLQMTVLLLMAPLVWTGVLSATSGNSAALGVGRGAGSPAHRVLGAPPALHELSPAPATAATGLRAATDTLNWSGYVAQDASFSDVRGTFTQPAIRCRKNQLAYSALWVGIDGFSSDTVEQIGTDSVCLGKQQSYAAFYELYPAAAVTLSSSSYPVAPGDTLSAEVTGTAATGFTLNLQSSEGWTFSTTGSAPDAAGSSAEWIVEAPSLCLLTDCFVLPLANFGTAQFTAASATGSGTTGSISAFTNQPIDMVTKKHVVKALPSALSGGGSGFTDTWHHS